MPEYKYYYRCQVVKTPEAVHQRSGCFWQPEVTHYIVPPRKYHLKTARIIKARAQSVTCLQTTLRLQEEFEKLENLKILP